MSAPIRPKARWASSSTSRPRNINFPDLLVQLDVIPAAGPHPAAAARRRREGAQGRPGRDRRGFVLHSSDFFIENSTLPIDEGVCLTATLDILKAIARGDGPAERDAGARLCRLGAGPARERDPAERLAALPGRSELIFGTDIDGKYDQGAEEDRHRSRHAVERSRATPKLGRRAHACDVLSAQPQDLLRRRSAALSPSSALIGSPKA